ncbi:hypothetical protein HDV06_001452 [Boothiomyces sp. JEL0866]|nr:hypothetical protein HDV06_001452 [Boothiomyces sp. JEL0866]
MSEEGNTEPNTQPNNPEEETPQLQEYIITFQIFFPTDDYAPNGFARRMNLRPLRHRRPPIPDFIEHSYLGGLTHYIIQQFLLRRLDASGNRTYPASQEALEALQKFPHLSEKRRQKHKLCVVCQEEFPKGPYPDSTTCSSEQTQSNENETADSEKCEINYEEIISTNDEEYNEGITSRMKDRNEMLKNEVDTDDESEEEPENIPSNLKRKRSSSNEVSQKKIKISEEK